MTTVPLSSRFSSLSSLPPADLAPSPQTPARELSTAQQTLRALLVDPATRQALVKRLHRRVPQQDVEDLVQDVFVAALEAEHVPETVTECTKWLFTIARHKRADYLEGRTLYTNVFSDSPDEMGQEDPAPEAPRSARDQLRWVQRQLESGALPAEVASWMTRQSEGESWASIGKSANVKPCTVRQRVRYHRQQLRERWLQDSKPPDSKPLWKIVIAQPHVSPSSTDRQGEAGALPVSRLAGREISDHSRCRRPLEPARKEPRHETTTMTRRLAR